MKKHLCVFAIFAMIHIGASGQIEPDSSLHAFIKFHPIALINVDRPSIQGSAEVLYKKWGLEFTYGKRYKDFGWLEDSDTTTVKFFGENFRVELKRYDLVHKKTRKKFRNYVGLSYFYIHDLFNAQARFDADCHAVKRKVHVFALQYGWTLTIKRFGCEAYASIGVRHKTQTLLYNEFIPDNSIDLLGNYGTYHGYLPHTNFCLKIFFKLF